MGKGQIMLINYTIMDNKNVFIDGLGMFLIILYVFCLIYHHLDYIIYVLFVSSMSNNIYM